MTRMRFHGDGRFVGDAQNVETNRQDRGYREQPAAPERDAQTPRGRHVLSLPVDRFVIEETDGEYRVFDFGQAADPSANLVTQAIAKFQAGLAAEGTTHRPATADRLRDNAARIRALQRVYDAHDWTGHGK